MIHLPNYLKKKTSILLLGGMLVFLCPSCMTVKAYQKQYVNDEQMQLGTKKLQFFETNMETYREASSGANGGKVGGGCGCN